MADTITTKIFSSVYKIIAGALGAIGWVIKPSFRNWFDKLVIKVQKLFYRSKLGQSIKELPPEVEQSVIEKFQAIIGIVVVVVMVWIIVSHIKGEGDSINGDDADGKSFSGKGATADEDAWSGGNASDKPDRFAPKESVSSDTLDDERYTKGYIAYKQARRAAFLKEHPGITKEAYRKMYEKAVQSEFNRAWNQGHLLKIDGDKINSEDLNISSGGAADDVTNNTDTATHSDSDTNTNTTQTNTEKSADSAASTKSGNAELHGDDKVGGDMSLHSFHRRYLGAKMQEWRTSHPNASQSDIMNAQRAITREFNIAQAKGKILTFSDGKTVPIDAKDANSAVFFNGTGAVEGKNVNLDALDKTNPGLEHSISANQLLDGGLTSAEFTSYSGIHVKLDLSNIPESDRNMPLNMLAEKYIKGVAEADSAARKADGAIGEYL